MASKITDLIFTYSFLKRLVTPFNETRAYELGIIDERGKKIKDPKSKEELDSYSTFERLVFNIKKIIERVPGGKSKLGSYAAALFLIREHKNPKEDYSEREIIEELEKNMSYLKENDNKDLKTFKEALKHTHMVLDPDGRVMSMHSSERHANDSAKPTGNLLKKQGKVVKLRKPISTTRGDRLIGQLPAHNLGEDTPANATGAAVAGTGDDSSTVVVRPDARKKYMKKYLADYLARRKKREEARKKVEMRKLMGLG
jgi:hypothetical protein